MSQVSSSQVSSSQVGAQRTDDVGTTVRREVRVGAPPAVAFRVFTEQFGTWWPAEHHLGDGPVPAFVLEAHEGGRIFERGADGVEQDWGRVTASEPPHRLVVSWELDAEWRHDPARASEVEVFFTAEGEGTRVVLVHRHLDRAGATWPAMRDAVAGERGWPGILARYAAAVATG